MSRRHKIHGDLVVDTFVEQIVSWFVVRVIAVAVAMVVVVMLVVAVARWNFEGGGGVPTMTRSVVWWWWWMGGEDDDEDDDDWQWKKETISVVRTRMIREVVLGCVGVVPQQC